MIEKGRWKKSEIERRMWRKVGRDRVETGGKP